MTRWLLLFVFAGCGPWQTSYYRGSPRRLDVVKTPSAPELRWFASRAADGSVVVVAKRERAVSVERTLHYTAWRGDFTTTKNPLLELLELVFSIPLVVSMPAVFAQTQSFLGTDTALRKTVLHNSQALAVLNPAQGGWLAMKIESAPSDDDIFIDRPQVRDYTVRLPAPLLSMTYEALDDGGRAIATGEATTDAYGRTTLAVPEAAIALQLIAEGKTSVIAIEARR